MNQQLNNSDFSTLWIGGKLSKLEELAIKSFVHFGYSITIYLYNTDCVVPDGVLVDDANKIIDSSLIFKARGSYAIFSDIFRYRLLSRVKTTWVDTDCICLNSNFPLNSEYIFTEQEVSAQHDGIFTNHILAYPIDSPLCDRLNREAKIGKFRQLYRINSPHIKWGESGPILLSKLVDELELTNFAFPSKNMNPINFDEVSYFFDPSMKSDFFDKCSEAYIAHCSNVFVTAHQGEQYFDKNNFTVGSAIHELFERVNS